MPVSTVKLACLAISLPWSQVIVRKNSPGRLVTARRMAASTLSASLPSGRCSNNR